MQMVFAEAGCYALLGFAVQNRIYTTICANECRRSTQHHGFKHPRGPFQVCSRIEHMTSEAEGEALSAFDALTNKVMLGLQIMSRSKSLHSMAKITSLHTF